MNVPSELRPHLLWSISKTIWDYRIDDGIPWPTADHVDRWVKQFPEDKQLPILFELDHVLRSTYFSKARVHRSLLHFALSPHLTGPWPAEFWTKTALLQIQPAGDSQRRLNSFLRRILSDRFGASPASPEKAQSFVYLDDAIYTGKRARDDLRKWLAEAAPGNVVLDVITIACYQEATKTLAFELPTFAANKGKHLTVRFWARFRFEDDATASNDTDAAYPKRLPSDSSLAGLPRGMIVNTSLRKSGKIASNQLFSSEEGRDALEQGLLWGGSKIYPKFRNLKIIMPPLGRGTTSNLGFGNLFATFLNCPNATPTALWAPDPWYPLFPRRNNG